MLFHPSCPPDTDYIPVTYQFLEPVRLRIHDPNTNQVTLMGYGIGDCVDVLEPRMQYLVPSVKRREKIALADGSWVVDPPNSIKLKTVWAHKTITLEN